MQDLNRRNTETVEKIIADMYSKIYDQQTQIGLLNNTVGGLMTKITSIEQELLMQKAKNTGNGPSVK
jgi:hypothetical protein